MTTILYDSHIVLVLIHFYLDSKNISKYHERWDTYLATKGLWDEYFYMMMKTDDQVARIVTKAKEEAGKISTSPLMKVMEEK